MTLRLSCAVASVLLIAVPAIGPSARCEGQTPPAPATPTVNVSGLVFGNYQYYLSGPNRDFNQFVLDRAYVTLRATITDRWSARVTTDVFQSGDQNGWTIRAKYAYFQYDFLKRGDWRAVFRAGMLHNVVVEHVETFWPRFIERTPIEKNGAFASADVGAATLITLPGRLGEMYAHVVNGPGYTRRETDRFKDYGLRISLTPLLGRMQGPLSTLTLSPWYYDGATASRFVRGGADGSIAPVGGGLPRDRYGILLGIRDPRLTVAVEAARLRTVTDSLVVGPPAARAVGDSRASIASVFGVARPLALFNDTGRSRLGFIGRYDMVEANRAANNEYHYFLGGLLVDLNARAQLSLNYQEQLTNEGAPVLPSPGSFRAVFTNVVVSF